MAFTTSITVLFLICLLSPILAQIPPARFLQKKFKTVSNNKRMAYVEVGTGDPIVFLHGNPTSSYLWRNIMPFLEGRGRLIAPDLIGMGDSDKLDRSGPNRYTLSIHSNYLYQLLEQLGVKTNVTLVIHDWGSALGFLWAFYNRFNPDAVKGIVFMEAIAAPFPSFAEFPADARDLFKTFRSPAGEKLILENNFFVENLLPSLIIRNLTKEEFDEYRRPYLNPGEDRRPTLTWPRQIPIGGIPADVTVLVSAYGEWLRTSKVRKLFINVEPGALSEFMRPIVRKWAVFDEVTVRGIHFVQEDSPNEIGKAILDWL